MASDIQISSVAKGHWPDVARLWQQVGPPLRPSAQDMAFLSRALKNGRWEAPPRALILGVTPELYELLAPLAPDLIAMDHTQAMIDCVWTGPRSAVMLADWLKMPLPDASRDVVVCDGGLHLLSYPEGQRNLVLALRRVIAKDGLCMLRLFAPPAEQESVDCVFRDLLEGIIPNLNILKLRLGMALQQNFSSGVELSRVWSALNAVAPDLASLARLINWSQDHLLAIDTYKESANRYYFVSVDAVRKLFCEDVGGFEFVSVDTPSYELGERCPTVVFRRVHEDKARA